MTDSELLDWFQTQDGAGLLSDDNGHWAVSATGTQSLPVSDDGKIATGPVDVWTSFLVEAKDWKPSIREALRAYYDESEET